MSKMASHSEWAQAGLTRAHTFFVSAVPVFHHRRVRNCILDLGPLKEQYEVDVSDAEGLAVRKTGDDKFEVKCNGRPQGFRCWEGG